MRTCDSYRISIFLTYLALKKTDGSWRMMMDYHKLNQVLTSVEGIIPVVVLLLEQISATCGIWYADIDLACAFFLCAY